ncbi:MAG: DMT family transporter [Lachnospiraceae bacterium]|nr:DMT family transporter [Lachnospiraceae bacterium]MDE6251454.1 DMT family transporter [Lachnospiraceae bacterium]
MDKKTTTGHIASLITIVIWGTTFISTKILLGDFKPMEILFFRFLLGFLALVVACPKRLKWNGLKQELIFAAAGLTGICLYYLLENVALTFTMASNVGVIISIAPFFTAILSYIFLRETEKPRVNFYIGFIIAIVGICLINFNGSKMHLNPLGDLLSVAAAVVWACYSILSKKISSFGIHTILTTRRVFAYGILFMIPLLFMGDFHIGIERFKNLTYLGNILFLGIGASALCFVTWSIAIKLLGAIKTSIYIYLVPVITMVASTLILNEKITVMAVAGAVLTLSGLLFSEWKGKGRRVHE